MSKEFKPNILIPHEHRADRRIVDHNQVVVDESYDKNDVHIAEVEMAVAKRLAVKLQGHYPKVNWKIRVDVQTNTVVISCDDVSTRHGYLLSLHRTMEDLENQMKRVGGEILERGKISRSNPSAEDIKGRERDLRETLVDLDNG